MSEKKILIVEDEGLVALDLQIRLEEAGYIVTAVADNMNDALAAAAETLPDLALMDIRIKGEHDGIETAARLRQEFDIPSIFVTAFGDLSTIDRAKTIEPYGYIVKPVVNVDLRPPIEIALWKHSMERKLRISEAWQSALLRNIADAIVATDADNKVVTLNRVAESLTGWKSADAKGADLDSVFSLLDENSGAPVSILTAQPAESGAGPHPYLLRNRRKKKTELIEATVSENRDGDKPLGAIVVFRDISKRRWIEAEILRLSKMRALATFGSGIGEEIERILDGIEKLAVGQGVNLNSGGWIERARVLTGQIRQLGLDQPPARQILDLNAFLRGIEPRLRQLCAGREICYEFQAVRPAIEANPEELEHMILQAIEELGCSIPRTGKLQIGAEFLPGQKRVTISIQDFGESSAYGVEEHGGQGGAIPSLAAIHYYMAMHDGDLGVMINDNEWSLALMEFPAVRVLP
jgi:PAS domain S-box-containing protein